MAFLCFKSKAEREKEKAEREKEKAEHQLQIENNRKKLDKFKEDYPFGSTIYFHDVKMFVEDHQLFDVHYSPGMNCNVWKTNNPGIYTKWFDIFQREQHTFIQEREFQFITKEVLDEAKQF